jgi:hypothetical protein
MWDMAGSDTGADRWAPEDLNNSEFSNSIQNWFDSKRTFPSSKMLNKIW